MERLLSYPFVEQRSPEWYRQRHGMITASSCADALHKNPYSTYQHLLATKVFPEACFEPNPAMHHGVKYEPIACMLYQKMGYAAGGTVQEFGLIGHPTLSFLGASPDGIVVDGNRRGTMIEIKCPFRRKIRSANTLKSMGLEYYWIQIQVQLECCDLETCDFWQCDIKELETKEEWDSYADGPKGCIIEWLSPESEEKKQKGLVVEFEAQYVYPPLDVMVDNKWEEWLGTTLPLYQQRVHRVIWWHLKKCLCTTVKRDPEWFQQDALPQLQKFWDEVIYYRNNPAAFVEVQRKEMEKYLHQGGSF